MLRCIPRQPCVPKYDELISGFYSEFVIGVNRKLLYYLLREIQHVPQFLKDVHHKEETSRFSNPSRLYLSFETLPRKRPNPQRKWAEKTHIFGNNPKLLS